MTLALSACGGGSDSASSTSGSTSASTLSPLAQLGDQLFNDRSLSVSGQQACATCHVKARAFTADPSTDHGLPVPLGGPNMDIPGFRNTPTLMYVSFAPPFSLASDNTASGGFFRDGRASTLAVQAEQPFLTAFEMANSSSAEVMTRLEGSATSLALFEQVYGTAVFSNADTVLADMGLALQAYETESPEFHPFTSKYDAWLAGTTQLTAQEQQGLALFNNPGKGNCTACHPSQVQGFSSHALFTDFTFDNIGVPRNWSIPYNQPVPVSPISSVSLTSFMPAAAALDVPSDAEYSFYDLGLCAPFTPASFDPNPRPLFSSTTTLCGFFKVPTLRNIAVTAPYFHNGVFSSLQEVVEWYVTRDINNNTGNNPAPSVNPYQSIGTFYTGLDGSPDQFEYNDLPVRYDANVNIVEVPYTPPTFSGGQSPTLTTDEINDVVAFLCTLTDGYDPANPSAYNVPAQCTVAATQTSNKEVR